MKFFSRGGEREGGGSVEGFPFLKIYENIRNVLILKLEISIS